MKFRKTFLKQLLGACFSVGFLVVSFQANAAVSLSLSGMGAPSDFGFGAKGLYLGPNFDSGYLNHSYTNWT